MLCEFVIKKIYSIQKKKKKEYIDMVENLGNIWIERRKSSLNL